MKREFSASAPSKVNLHLGVGELRQDGYHDLVTVFQAIDRREIVRILVDSDLDMVTEGSVVTGMETSFGVDKPEVDIDTPSNLAWRAVDAVIEACRRTHASTPLPRVKLEVEKNVFVAGGMAGGSADAAAALVAANSYVTEFGCAGLDSEELAALAAELGADVPFLLLGGTALGTGRGDRLVEMISRGVYWWVFINPATQLPTGEVFARLDDLRHNSASLVPHLSTTQLSQALISGDPAAVAKSLHNDLEPAAVDKRARLRALLEATSDLALRAIVSGSGPTVALLCADAQAAEAVLERVKVSFSNYDAFIATGPAEGATAL